MSYVEAIVKVWKIKSGYTSFYNGKNRKRDFQVYLSRFLSKRNLIHSDFEIRKYPFCSSSCNHLVFSNPHKTLTHNSNNIYIEESLIMPKEWYFTLPINQTHSSQCMISRIQCVVFGHLLFVSGTFPFLFSSSFSFGF